MWVLSISPTHSVFTVVWANDSIIWLRVAYKTAFILIFLYLITGFLNIQISLYLQCIVYWQEVIWWQVMIKGICISKLHCIFTAMCTDKKGQHIYHMEGHSDSINHNFYDVGLSLWQNPVSLRVSDDRYIVLSFVLCGCIAGILLASVIIFLIRRNSRSKQKLAQLSSGPTGEGNEPSQDYQVNKIIIKIIISSLDNKVDWSFLSSDW